MEERKVLHAGEITGIKVISVPNGDPDGRSGLVLEVDDEQWQIVREVINALAALVTWATEQRRRQSS